MMRNVPPLNWLRAFEVSARHLSFTQAARELNLTQVAVSKQIKQLELHLKDKLFIRHPRSLELTKTAEAYLPKVRDAFERLEDGTKEVFGRRKTKALTLRAAVGFSVNWLVPKLAEFYSDHPEVPIRIVSSVWNEEVGSREFDLDIRYGTGNWAGMRADRLTWETITPVCSPTLLSERGIFKASDLENHTLIDVLGYQEGWSTWLRASGGNQIDAGVNVQVDTSLLAFELAAAGAGVAIARSSMVQKELTSGRLTCPFEKKVPIKEAFYLVSPGGEQEHPHCEFFRNWLLTQIARG